MYTPCIHFKIHTLTSVIKSRSYNIVYKKKYIIYALGSDREVKITISLVIL